MTIRRQIFLSVLPLFVGFGALGSAMSWWLQTTGARSAFHEEARSLAIAIAEFLEPADLATLRAGPPMPQTRLGQINGRLERWGIARRIYLLNPETAAVLVDTAPTGTGTPGANDLRGLAAAEVRRLPWRRLDDQTSRLPVITRAVDGTVVLGVEISADSFLANQRHILSEAIKDGVIVVLLGVAISIALSAFLGRNVRQLQLAAKTIGSPSFSTASSGAIIYEVADLGNTFSVMHSVHGATVERTYRSLAESDFYRAEQDLTQAFQAEFQPKSAWHAGHADVAWLGVGNPPPAYLAGAVTFGSAAGAAFAGVAGTATDLNAALRARAATAYLADTLRHRAAADVAAATMTMFGLTQLKVVTWQGTNLTRWSSATEAAPEADAGAWPAGRAVSLSCLGPVNTGRLALYLARVPDARLATLLDDLPPLLDVAESGVVLVLRTAH